MIDSIEYFLYLHKILIPNDKFCEVNILNTICKIKYEDIIEIEYNFDSSLNKLFYSLNLKLNETDSTITKNVVSEHFYRILSKNQLKLNSIDYNENSLTEFLIDLNKIINSSIYNYCTICADILDIKGIKKISHCKNLKCKKKYYSLVTDNRVMDNYNKDRIVFLFLIDILILGTVHPKGELVFTPLPYTEKSNNFNEFKKNIENKKIFEQKDKLIEILEESENDFVLFNKTTPFFYSILKNAVSNNYFSMCSRENIFKSKLLIKNASNIKFIHMNYSAEIENKFELKYFLFHGSNISCWYSIIKNGLKVMSGTKLMQNDASYGKGIYFSNSFMISLGYSKTEANIFRNNTHSSVSNTIAVGVFEVQEDPEKYKKSNGIYVINNESIILLRTLVLLDYNSTVPSNISDYFLKETPQHKLINKLNVENLKNKRLIS